MQSQPINQAVPPTQVQVQPVSTPIFNPVPAHQVFQADQTAVITILQQMMEEMRSWRNPAPSPQVQAAVVIFPTALVWLGRIDVWDEQTGFSV